MLVLILYFIIILYYIIYFIILFIILYYILLYLVILYFKLYLIISGSTVLHFKNNTLKSRKLICSTLKQRKHFFSVDISKHFLKLLYQLS